MKNNSQYKYIGINALFVLCLICIVFPGSVFGQDNDGLLPMPVDESYKDIYGRDAVMTRWVDPYGSHPVSFAEWRARVGKSGPFMIEKIATEHIFGGRAWGAKISVIVNDLLYGQTAPSIDQYVMDLTGEGYNVELYTTSGGTPEDMRAFLQGRYADDMEGCVFIGDLPVAWYETEFGDPPEHADFPIDLFYMDMDGLFYDSDADGMYDSHTGETAPDIWMARLTASPMTIDGVNEVDLIVDYFAKNHAYRCDLLPVANRALVYIDDDWAPGDWWDMNVGEAYADRTFIKDKWTTWSPDYESRLPSDYESILVCVHSWSGGHAFKNPADQWSWTYNTTIKAIQPPAHFYNLFACSNARYTDPDYCSGWYIFGPDHGLASVGSTKSGSMLYFEDYYRPFGQGLTIGESFRDWFIARAADSFEEWEISWFYGMTLHGDPTLTIQKVSTTATLQYDNGAASYMMSLPNGSGWDMYNTRFTTEQACTLSAITTNGSYPGSTPFRMYIMNSDGTHPTTIIDSVDIPDGNLTSIDINARQITFGEGEDFHVAFSCLESTPVDTHWIYMDDGDPTQYRSGLYDNGSWKLLSDIYGDDYNFLIRVQVRNPEPPSITILNTSLSDGMAGLLYNESLLTEGGQVPFDWSTTAGVLPDGLNINPASGEISGVPESIGVYNFSVRVTDASNPQLSDVQHLSIAIQRACGDANGDGIINIFDITFLINYLYKGGPAPDPEMYGDANGDGAVNIFDITHLIAFLYSGGPPPICP